MSAAPPPGLTDGSPTRGRAGIVLAILGLLAFDAATVMPAAAGLYLVKRAMNFDTVPGVDMLPDDVVEGAIGTVGYWLRREWASRSGQEPDTDLAVPARGGERDDGLEEPIRAG